MMFTAGPPMAKHFSQARVMEREETQTAVVEWSWHTLQFAYLQTHINSGKYFSFHFRRDITVTQKNLSNTYYGYV